MDRRKNRRPVLYCIRQKKRMAKEYDNAAAVDVMLEVVVGSTAEAHS